jgi:hypothetical protein
VESRDLEAAILTARFPDYVAVLSKGGLGPEPMARVRQAFSRRPAHLAYIPIWLAPKPNNAPT